MTRRQWQAAVRAAVFPVGMRPVKATLLSLPVDTDGALRVWRERLSETTGLPIGTLKRHLARAVDAGWLTHEVHGGHGRQGMYRVAVPTASCGPEMSHKAVELRPIHYTATPGSCGPRGEPLSNKSANVSEHGAVDDLRERRNHHDDSRDQRNDGETELRIERRPTRYIHIDALSPWARLAYAPILKLAIA
jgi:hypothetical protein